MVRKNFLFFCLSIVQTCDIISKVLELFNLPIYSPAPSSTKWRAERLRTIKKCWDQGKKPGDITPYYSELFISLFKPVFRWIYHISKHKSTVCDKWAAAYCVFLKLIKYKKWTAQIFYLSLLLLVVSLPSYNETCRLETGGLWEFLYSDTKS